MGLCIFKLLLLLFFVLENQAVHSQQRVRDWCWAQVPGVSGSSIALSNESIHRDTNETKEPKAALVLEAVIGDEIVIEGDLLAKATQLIDDLPFSAYDYELNPMSVGIEVEAALPYDFSRAEAAKFILSEELSKNRQSLGDDFFRRARTTSVFIDPFQKATGADEYYVINTVTGKNTGVLFETDVEISEPELFQGAEITSPIIENVTEYTEFKRLLLQLKRQGMNVNKGIIQKAGLHVHADMTGYSQEELVVLLLVYSLYENQIFKYFNPDQDRFYQIMPFAERFFQFMQDGDPLTKTFIDEDGRIPYFDVRYSTSIGFFSLVIGNNIKGSTLELRVGNTSLESDDIDKLVYFFAHFVKAIRSKDIVFFEIVKRQLNDKQLDLTEIISYFETLGQPLKSQ